jgi:hypothetical protein
VSLNLSHLQIYLRHGAPRLRPFSLPALQHYLALVVPTSDFHWLVIGFCFFGHIPITVIMAPLVLEALQGVLTWLGVYAPNSFAWTRAGSKLYAYMQGKKVRVRCRLWVSTGKEPRMSE